MIQNINVFSAKPNNNPQKLQSKITIPYQSKNDAFVKAASCPSFKGAEFSKNFLTKFDKTLEIAEGVEECGLPERSEPLYIKAFNSLDAKIKEGDKNEKIKDIGIIERYLSVTVDIMSNLGVQATLDKPDDEKKSLLDRSHSYLKRAIDTSQKHFEPSVYDHTVFTQYEKFIEDKGIPIRVVEKPNEPPVFLKTLLDEVRPYVKHFIPVKKPAEVFLSDKEILAKRDETKAKINEMYPTIVEDKKYLFQPADAFAEFKELSHNAINSALNNTTPSGKVDLGSAKRLLGDTMGYLRTKDPDQTYWGEDEFKLTNKRLLETEGRHNIPPEDAAVIDHFMDVQNDKKPLIERLEHLDQMRKAPSYVGALAMLNIHERISTNAVSLLVENGSTEAKHQLQKISQNHPVEQIRKFAATSKNPAKNIR